MQRVLMMIIVPLIMMIFVPTYAKNELTLKDAIKIGLQNNYNIRIARNTAKISENNKGKGTAGFLPMLDLSGNYQINEVDEESNSPISFGKSNTDSWGGSISLNWMLFDGFSMFIDRKRFNDLAILGEYQAREIIENNVVSISRAYFDLVRQELLLDAAIESKNISETRLQKTKVRKDLGGVSSTDYLNAQVSFNNDKSALLNQELQVIVSRKQLNTLLGRDSGTPVNVAKNNDVLPLRWEYNDILELAQERNSGLKIAQQNKRVADRNASSSISSFLPRLSLNASYGYTDRTVSSDLPAFGSDVLTERTDATIGLLLSFNLFNGGRNRIDWQNTRLEARNRKLALEDARNQLQGYVQEAFETYNKRIQLVEIEEQNLLTARQNIELHQERYQLGTSSSLEFRDAQLSLIRAQTSLITSQFQARITALEIEQLIGNLQIE